MVLLKEKDLQRVLERSDPSFDKLLLRRVFAHPSDVEGDDRQGSLRHGLEELGRPASRTIPGGCPVRALSFVS
ncbi:unnamed protein product [Sphagnum troendelagicum]|uniref:Uncharacterized protein n=1 Tax=Sphagnum troendelagicum TaxID=128251 RepID=A0ABP0T9S7_9BRYO